MTNYFKISEFLIEDKETVPVHVVEKLIAFHLPELNKMREELGEPIMVSQKSGYRSYKYELSKGRSGKSEHTFQKRGAVDITCSPDSFQKLVRLAQKSGYTRVAVYPKKKFIHCDFNSQKKRFFINTENGWELI